MLIRKLFVHFVAGNKTKLLFEVKKARNLNLTSI